MADAVNETPTQRRLDSWKAIARFLGKSERTVRRWEADEGLPVHRHRHQAQSSVFAFEDELSAWRRSRAEGQPSAPATDAPNPAGGVVVLPFQFLGADERLSYLALGFTDELISDIAKVDAIRTISRTSSLAVAERALSAQEIRTVLGVDHLIEGAIRQSGDELKISVQIICCSEDRRLWGNEYTSTLDDVFSIQAKLAAATVTALKQRLKPGQADPFSARFQGERRVWEILVRARVEALSWTDRGIRRAIGLIEDNLVAVGAHPQMLAAAGRYHLFLRETGVDMGPGPLEAAGRYLERLEAAAPELSEKRHLDGWIAYHRGAVDDAIRSLRQADLAAPDDPDTLSLLTYCYFLSGLDDLATPLVERLLDLDPLNPLNHSLDGCAHLFAGRFDRADEAYERMCELDPSNVVGTLFRVMALSLNGDGERVTALVHSVSSEELSGPIGRVFRAFDQAAKGRSVEHEAEIDAIIEQSTTDMFPRLLAQAYGLSGQKSEALHWLKIAASLGLSNATFVGERDPSFNELNATAEFQEIMNRMSEATQRLRNELREA